MIDFKKGDLLVSKTNDNGLTIGKHYEIVRIEKGYYYIIDNYSNPWYYSIKKTTHNWYYNEFFYSKSELRDMKLKELGI